MSVSKVSSLGKRRFVLHWVLSVMLLLSLTACSNKPGTELINQSIDSLVRSENIEGVFDIKNAKRSNGFLLDDFYHVEIGYERHCLVGIEDAALIINDLQIDKDPKNLVEGILTEFIGMIAQTGVLQYNLEGKYGSFKQGDILQEVATIKFIKTENGWMEYQPAE